MQADPGVDEERPLVHDPDLHASHASVDERPRRFARLFGDAVRSRRVVERAVRHDPERAPRRERRAGRGVDRAVAADGNDGARFAFGAFGGAPREGFDLGAVLCDEELAAPPCGGQLLLDRREGPVPVL